MTDFQYIDNTGAAKTVSAADSATALRTAPNIGASSGVRALSSATPASSGLVTTPTNPAVTAPTVNPDIAAVNDSTTTRSAAYSMSSNPTAEDRSSAIAGFQGQIDALNQVYAQQKQAETLAGKERVGSNVAIEARRGLLGSDFGTAGQNAVAAANVESQNSIDAKHNVDIQAIYGKASESAVKMAENRVSAAQKGADALLEEKKSRVSTATAAISQAAKDYLANGNDGTKLTTQDAQTISDSYRAKGINISVGDVTSAIKDAVTASQKASLDTVKTQADINKINQDIIDGKRDKSKPIEVGGYIYKLDANNNWVKTGTAVKPGGGTTSNAGNINTDIQGAIGQFQQKMKANNWRGVTPGDYQTMADYLQKAYGTQAVAKLKTQMKAVGVMVDTPDAVFPTT